MTKSYAARLATRVTTSVDTRLRQPVLVSRRRISHVLDDVLAALPSAEDLSTQLTHRASPSQDHHARR